MNDRDQTDRSTTYTVTVPLRKPRVLGRDELPAAHTWGPIEFIDLSAAHMESRSEDRSPSQRA